MQQSAVDNIAYKIYPFSLKNLTGFTGMAFQPVTVKFVFS